tara:strand:- start:3176 stop:3715 length:540 start_codon:yes stop_codon:yes gene_type:complete
MTFTIAEKNLLKVLEKYKNSYEEVGDIQEITATGRINVWKSYDGLRVSFEGDIRELERLFVGVHHKFTLKIFEDLERKKIVSTKLVMVGRYRCNFTIHILARFQEAIDRVHRKGVTLSMTFGEARRKARRLFFLNNASKEVLIIQDTKKVPSYRAVLRETYTKYPVYRAQYPKIVSVIE